MAQLAMISTRHDGILWRKQLRGLAIDDGSTSGSLFPGWQLKEGDDDREPTLE